VSDYRFGNILKQNLPVRLQSATLNAGIPAMETDLLSHSRMRLSTQAYAQIYGVGPSHAEYPEMHFSLDLLRDLVKRGKPLNARQKQHAGLCRDCREFVEDFSAEARRAGKSVPDLLPKSMPASTARS
jgi:hypothetical protein